MSKMLIGSICLSDISKHFKENHSAFTKGKNEKNYVAITIWENDTPDQYGNTVSIQLNSTKDKRESEGKIYIGNAKPLQQSAAHQQQATTTPLPEGSDDLPF